MDEKERPRGPIAMTQDQVDLLVAGAPEAREVRARLLSDHDLPAEEPYRDEEERTSPVPLEQGDLDELRASQGGRRVRQRIQEATKPTVFGSSSEDHERPNEVPPHLRQK